MTVVLSGYDEYELVREAFRLGAHDYLLKGNLDTASLTAMLTELRRRIFADGGTAAAPAAAIVQDAQGVGDLIQVAHAGGKQHRALLN